MNIYTEPFLHAVITPPIEVYEYAKSVYPEPPLAVPNCRTNIDIDDTAICNYIDSVVNEAYDTFCSV